MTSRRVGHYRVEEKIGEGGMGVVHRAVDESLGREVAIKFLGTEMLHDEAAVQRFHLEARLASSLSHPNVCTVYDTGHDGGRPYIVMERLVGTTLDRELLGGALPTERVLEIAIQVADALDAVHAVGVVHRDVKPANVFIAPGDLVKVLDFGIARPLDGAGGDELARFSVPGMLAGTVTHLAPEQVEGARADPRSDVFALGVVLYQMATGTLPFRGATPGDVLREVLHHAPPPADALNPEVPARLASAIARALAKDPRARFQSAAELRAELLRVRLEGGAGWSRAARPSAPGPAVERVVAPWDAVARDGREFAERGRGLMYWYRVPLGSIAYADGFRGTLLPALENAQVSALRFVLDRSRPASLELWRALVVPRVRRWGGDALTLEETDEAGRFSDAESGAEVLSWVVVDLSDDYGPCFKVMVDDPARGLRGVPDAQVFLATTARRMHLPDGAARVLHLPDVILRARGAEDTSLARALGRVARQWDHRFLADPGGPPSLPPTAPVPRLDPT